MIGVALNLVFSFHTYWQQTNRGHGDDKQFLSLDSTLEAKVFADEESAIKWILKTLLRYGITLPSRASSHRCCTYENKDFIDSYYDYIEYKEWTLEDFVEVLHEHWTEECTRDREEFYNSKITLFDPTVSADDSEDD